MKKYFALLLSLSLVMVLVGCEKDMSNNITNTTTQQTSDKAVNSGEVELDLSAEPISQEELTREAETKKDENKVENKETTTKKVISDNPADWTKAQVVEFYKNSAKKSDSLIQSSQRMVLHKLEVKNSGLMGGFINMVEPVINTVIGNNQLTFDGVTGGYNKLKASDAKTAKAYKEGKYTVIEMTMVEQTDGIYGSSNEGTVGHAISVVGNISVVTEQFPSFDIDFENSDIKINYTKPTVKVKINEKGIIEKGTWSHYSKIYIKNLVINNMKINQANAEIEYVITTGKGF